jgi:hypothetical protein
MRALAGDGTAKIWNEDANAYVVRWDQMFEYVTAALRSSVGDDRLPRQLGERDTGDPVLAQFAADHFPAINVALRVHPAVRALRACRPPAGARRHSSRHDRPRSDSRLSRRRPSWPAPL